MKPLKIVFVLLFVSISLNALTFKEIKTNDKFKTIKIQGKFDRSSLKQFNEILTKYKNEKIKFIPYSKGGYANDVFVIQNLIKDYKNVYTDVTILNSYCKSSCDVSLLGSKKIKGFLQFHKITIKNPTIKTWYGMNNEQLYVNIQLYVNLVDNKINKEKAKKIVKSENFISEYFK